MRVPYGYTQNTEGVVEINLEEAKIVREIFRFYLAGASLGKVVDMLSTKGVPSPTGKTTWTRNGVDHVLSNAKYIPIVGLETYMDVQFEKGARCNVDYERAGAQRKTSRYTSPAIYGS